jgi:phage-related minor tail protein
MSEQPQEWTPETVADIVAARPSVPIGVSVADAHNAALAAAWKEHDDVVDALANFSDTIKQLGAANQKLNQQLAAEQHKLKACEVLIRDLQKELAAKQELLTG